METQSQGFSNAEEIILLASERLTDEVYQRYVSGEISRDTLTTVYRHLSDWTKKSKELLEMMHQMAG